MMSLRTALRLQRVIQSVQTRSQGLIPIPVSSAFVRCLAQAKAKPVEENTNPAKPEKAPQDAPPPTPDFPQKSQGAKPAEKPLADPPTAGIERSYSPKIQKIVDDISALTLMEVADLNELLKKTLKIPDQAFMSAGSFAAAPATPAQDDEGVKKVEKSAFTVKLTKFDETKKVQLIKEIKGVVEGMNLVQAKKFVESLPQVVRQDIGKDEAAKLKAALEAVGGTVELD